MLEPLIMSKLIFDKLSKKQQDVIMALGAELEAYGTKEAMADDEKVAEVYAKKGAKVADLDEATVEKWRAIARRPRGRTMQARRRSRRSSLNLPKVSTPPDVTEDAKWRTASTTSSPKVRRRLSGTPPVLRPNPRARQRCDRALVIDCVGGRRIRPDLQRRQPLFLSFLDRLAGRAFGVPDRRAVFMSSSAVQAQRGHVAIEAIVAILPPPANRVRRVLVDVASLVFCAYFSWKSWTLLEEAWTENYHSGSTWGPPLWIPYSLMTVGMTLLSVQLLLQVIGELRGRKAPP